MCGLERLLYRSRSDGRNLQQTGTTFNNLFMHCALLHTLLLHRRLWNTTRELHYLVRPWGQCTDVAQAWVGWFITPCSCRNLTDSMGGCGGPQKKELRNSSQFRRAGPGFPFMDPNEQQSPGCVASAAAAVQQRLLTSTCVHAMLFLLLCCWCGYFRACRDGMQRAPTD